MKTDNIEKDLKNSIDSLKTMSYPFIEEIKDFIKELINNVFFIIETIILAVIIIATVVVPAYLMQTYSNLYGLLYVFEAALFMTLFDRG